MTLTCDLASDLRGLVHCGGRHGDKTGSGRPGSRRNLWFVGLHHRLRHRTLTHSGLIGNRRKGRLSVRNLETGSGDKEEEQGRKTVGGRNEAVDAFQHAGKTITEQILLFY